MEESNLQQLVKECMYELYKSHREMLPHRETEYFRKYHIRWQEMEEIYELNKLLEVK